MPTKQANQQGVPARARLPDRRNTVTILYSRLCRPPRVEAAPGGGGKRQQQVAAGRAGRPRAEAAMIQHPAEPLLSTGSEAEGARWRLGGVGGGDVTDEEGGGAAACAVADKAVSTEDHAELAAVLAALVRSKVTAIQRHSSSTSSSERRRRAHCTSQVDVGLLSSGILFPRKRYRHHRRRHRRHSSSSASPPRKQPRPCRLQETAFCTPPPPPLPPPPPPAASAGASVSYGAARTAAAAPQATPEPSRRARPRGYSNYNYNYNYTYSYDDSSPAANGAACCAAPSPAHSKLASSEYVSLTMEADDSGGGRRRGGGGGGRRKRRRRLRGRDSASGGGKKQKQKQKLLEPEDLPARARWTIIATACLLLLMSILLVGVTLRMAPIIDEMVGKRSLAPAFRCITKNQLARHATGLVKFNSFVLNPSRRPRNANGHQSGRVSLVSGGGGG
ncbi:serine/arginine repetitive matrix protein 1 [Schistocerca gregaria]|uniref:serine/arginine repetitive matrix protein 1 n=1 Tax=Schistocerca gregaria TaxID=7010 RepID=UPI00211F10DA|nr:serine/arginine repetitive matrix protein 1 [Schistocerca gregaria]